MKKYIILIIVIIFLSILVVGCNNNQSPSVSREDEINEEVDLLQEEDDDLEKEELIEDEIGTGEEEEIDEIPQDYDEKGRSDNDSDLDDNINNNIETSYNKDIIYNPFTGKVIDKMRLEKAVMISIENAPQSRPQDGLYDASIIYEFMVEGGLTRFLALYWGGLPEKVGPVRSVRPHLIKTAEDYNALLLHAGASPKGFELLQNRNIFNLDQIYNGGYYWRSSNRRAPHNLYTGNRLIDSYLDNLTGQEYNPRFKFSRVSFATAEDEIAEIINFKLWGGTVINYIFDEDENVYKRFYTEDNIPHMDDNGRQLQGDNIIVKFAETEVLDDEGRLDVKIEGQGEALVFKNGIAISGYWEKRQGQLTKFYRNDGSEIELTPGQTWIKVIPTSSRVNYGELTI